jgi:hypothetical protein
MHPLGAPTVANGWLYVPCIGPTATLQAWPRRPGCCERSRRHRPKTKAQGQHPRSLCQISTGVRIGDRWRLICGTASGQASVRHDPIPSSGGQTTDTDVEEFWAASTLDPSMLRSAGFSPSRARAADMGQTDRNPTRPQPTKRRRGRRHQRGCDRTANRRRPSRLMTTASAAYAHATIGHVRR